LQRLFRLEIASDLEMETIDLDRIVILSAVEPAARRLQSLEVSIEIHCAFSEEADRVKVLAEALTFAPAASRAGINGDVRMLSISVNGPPNGDSGEGGGAGSDGSPVVLPINGSSNVTIVDAPVTPNTDTTLAVTIALLSCLAAAVAVGVATYIARRRQQRKALAKNLADIKAFKNLLDLSRGAQDELTSNLTAEQLSLQTVTCSLEYGDSFDEDEYFSSGSQSEIDTFNDYSSGSSSDSDSSGFSNRPPHGASVDTWDGVSLASSRSTTSSLNSIREDSVDTPPRKMPRGVKRRVYHKTSASGTPRSSAGPSPHSTPRGRRTRAILSISEEGGGVVEHTVGMVEHTGSGRGGIVEASFVTAPPRPARLRGNREMVEKSELVGREAPIKKARSQRTIRGPDRNRTKVKLPDDAASTSSDSSAISLTLGSGDGTGSHSPADTGSGTHTPLAPRRGIVHTDSGVSSAGTGTGSTGVHLTIGSGTGTPDRTGIVHTDSGVSGAGTGMGITGVHLTPGSGTGAPDRTDSGHTFQTPSIVRMGSGVGSAGTGSMGGHPQGGDDFHTPGSGAHTPSLHNERQEEVSPGDVVPAVPRRKRTNIFSSMMSGTNVQFVPGSPGYGDMRLTSSTSYHETSYQEEDTDDGNGSEIDAVVLDLHLEESSPVTERLAHKHRLKSQMERGVQQFSVPLTPMDASIASQTPGSVPSSPSMVVRPNLLDQSFASHTPIGSVPTSPSTVLRRNLDSGIASPTPGAGGLQQFTVPLTPTKSSVTSSHVTPRNLSSRRDFKVPHNVSLATPDAEERRKFSVPLQQAMFSDSPVGIDASRFRDALERDIEEVHIEASMAPDDPN